MHSFTFAIWLTFLTVCGFTSGAVISEAEVVPLKQVCYDHYGCFGTESPWTSLLRPVSALPNPPYEVGTRFLLFTRSNRDEDVELMPDNEFILNFSPYNRSKKTIVLIHGFTDSAQADWVVNAKNALLDQEDVNIIAIDWARGASSNYLKATANTRLAGSQVHRFIRFLVNKGNLNLDELRVVGHSLGAHIAGYAGQLFNGQIGHITALDAADPYFAGTDPIVRLDPTDAKHVHSIVTDGNTLLRIGMGILAPIGHVNVYPNGGKGQPGCSGTIGSLIGSIFDIIFLNFDNIPKTWACSHVRAAEFYVESISVKCPFVAFKCNDYSSFHSGKCTSSCSSANSCTVLGYGSEKYSSSSSGNFYLNTNSESSYCQQTVRFDAPVSQTQAKTNGKVAITFKGSDGTSSQRFTVADGGISKGQILNSWLHVSSEAFMSTDERPSLVLRYTRGGLLPTTQPKYLALDNINVYVIDENLELKLVSYPEVTLEAGVDTVVDPVN